MKVPEILQLDLFALEQPVPTKAISRQEFLEQAYLRQEAKIAYKN